MSSEDEDYDSEEDVDYVPTEGDQVSEEEHSGDEEDLSLLNDEESQVGKALEKRKASKKKNAVLSRKRQGGIKLAGEENNEDELKKVAEENEEEKARKKELAEQIAKEEEEKKKEKEKKRADDLWSSFMSDVKRPPPKKPETSNSSLSSLTSKVPEISKGDSDKKDETKDSEKKSKVTITKVFDFAGEEVKITKEVDADSKEAKAEQKKQEEKETQGKQSASVSGIPGLIKNSSSLGGAASFGLGLKRPASAAGGGGLGSVLSKINKKSKMGTLDKSKLDWDSFKRKEGIEEDLKIHNKGKQGYTERMAFLNRTDQRQFELERDLRLGSSSSKR